MREELQLLVPLLPPMPYGSISFKKNDDINYWYNIITNKCVFKKPKCLLEVMQLNF